LDNKTIEKVCESKITDKPDVDETSNKDKDKKE
jgi:hypothetical protein